MQWRNGQGFTLLELLIAIAIVAILASLAMPGYQTIRVRAFRNEARLALLALQITQEQHYARYLRYTANTGTAATTESGSYEIALASGADGQSYTATAQARPTGRQARDTSCRWLSIDDTGRRQAASAECWG
jgi:type IV pilus assembly protein PilE